MISFKGKLSTEAKKFITEKHIKAATIFSVIESIIFAIPVILLGIFCDPIIYIFFVVVACIPLLNFALWVWDLAYITQIDFENGKYYAYYTKKKSSEQTYGGARDIEDIKSVIDFGNFYYIVVGGKVSSYLCQKNLLVEGSLADFEEMFADILVKQKL